MSQRARPGTSRSSRCSPAASAAAAAGHSNEMASTSSASVSDGLTGAATQPAAAQAT
jgi:hypothetical protein